MGVFTVVTNHVGILTWLTGGAILTAQLIPHGTGDVSVSAEALCWMLVLLLHRIPRIRILSWDEAKHIQSIDSMSWVAAASLAIIAVSHYVGHASSLLPAVTPVLLVLRHRSLLPQLHHSCPKFLHSLWLQAGIGASTIFILLHSWDFGKIRPSVFAMFGFVCLYAVLIRMFESNADLSIDSPPTTMSDIIRAICVRAIPLLTILAMVIGFLVSPSLFPSTVLLASLMKATHWSLLFWIAKESPWEIAATIGTFAACSRGAFAVDPFAPRAVVQSLLHAIAGLAALFQTMAFLPKFAKGRYLLLIFALWPATSIISHFTLKDGAALLPTKFWTGNDSGSKPETSPRHPIEDMILKAQVDFAHLLERQSRTWMDAESEYRRRYLREPPPGFDEWFYYAQSKDSVLIDDFNMIHDDLNPFWNVSPVNLLESIDHATSSEHLALRKCGIKNGTFYGRNEDWIIRDLGGLLIEVQAHLPDVEFAFDIVDEPREIISPESLKVGGVPQPEFHDAKHQSIWTQVIGSCHASASNIHEAPVYDHGIPFVQNLSDAKDVCLHPEFEHMYGFFATPETCILTDAPVPILSQSAPSSFGDIMYPSPWYAAKYGQQAYKGEEDPPWEDKKNNLHWRGSTTGSHSINGSWRHSHRQRFVQLAQTLNSTSHKFLKEVRPGVWEPHTAIRDLDSVFDIKFTAAIQCEDADCEEQKRVFDVAEYEEASQQFHSKFIFDIDGNAFSGRYYTLLQSRSAVLKQTLLKEWHDERLIPWVHYIPVSLGMEELPEIMRYMTTEEGLERAKEIADAGREWQMKALRRDDFTVYLYRLILELARIMDPARKVENSP
ncbi:hypothetical protein BCR34DRAFT_567608 [Clohesyomyces aquaticus]|uniref:Glycosyl transferase CAP10 domain-containing protein n=1 Tax=Clohesyomyces aquaticus TaxID=1231657 RepID=A0A1Y1ZIH3_9PLEO|nr:hypothetical protein BCR34DRAFT_567608 [Clohesyomyces aquaticus]